MKNTSKYAALMNTIQGAAELANKPRLAAAARVGMKRMAKLAQHPQHKEMILQMLEAQAA